MSAISRVVLFLLIIVTLAVSPAPAADPAARSDPPADVPADWWSQVQRSIQLEEYAVVAEGTAGTDFRAVNPAHRFEARFDANGLRLAATEGTSWTWGLSLTGWGRPGAIDAAVVAWLSADEDRVELDRGSLTEWFVNSPAGLEHGFTVPAPPRDDGNGLVFDLAIAGGLRPVFAEDGQAVDFYGTGNVSVLRYAKLIVTDTAGNVLPARMDPIAGGIRIVVEDSRAIYPITVDPLATSPSWTVVGEAGYAVGSSVATAGDVNGDGYSDVIVGANGNTGKVYLYLGGASGLATSALWTVVGEGEGDRFGDIVATAGDVNNDGYSDVIVGASGHTSSTGKAYLYLGGPSGLAASASWTAAGEAVSNFFGNPVATAGDVNGDGYSDVIVGAFATGDTGKAYLYLGGPSGLSASASWTAVGEGEDSFGRSVATAGDVNGDGYSDVVVGAPGYSFFGQTGKAYLYLGGSGGLSASASWTAVGEATLDNFGFSVATAGDVNGDGYSDVVVGAYRNTSLAGKAYLYLGGVSGLAASASWTAIGASLDQFGVSVATAGDVNGDGYSDVVIGAQLAGLTGEAYLYLGGASGLTTGASWTAVGENGGDRFGSSVAPAGDVNGDGYSDVIVGAWSYPGPGATTITGKAYLYLGGSSALTTSTSWTAVGEAGNSSFGISVATAGDVNGDGYSDVIVGASGHNSRTGKAYLYLGGAGGLAASVSWTAVGESNDNFFGFSVASAGDVNGDGYSDVIVGAFGHNSRTGKAYLYLGGAGGLSASVSWTAVGEAAGDDFGRPVAPAGDVNGDGYSDVVVGASNNTSLTGKAYLYLGGPSGLAASASWTAAGEATSDLFGYSVASAGDVNGDGYSDVVVGAFHNGFFLGKAYLYLGAASGLAASASWTAVGEFDGDTFGTSVAPAGDVNGDGYSDIVVGAQGYLEGTLFGKAYLYLGGAGGLSASVSWTAVGGITSLFGRSVASAGDVNGDGYSDVVVAANGSSNFTGKAYLYLGGPSGLATSASWTAVGEFVELSHFGRSVASAGDVNGDGYSDVVVGASGNIGAGGEAHLYLGGGGAGVALVPRQLRADLSAPIHLGGPAFEQQFRLGLTLRSPVGPVQRKLQWQVVPWGGDFDPLVNPIQEDPTWYSTPVALTTLIMLPVDLQRYIWRARVKYDSVQSPFLPSSPWFTLSGNGLHEADVLSTSELACSAPGEELHITTMSLDGSGKPVLHYQDPNQPAAVTGYNVYRAAAPTGPWVLLDSNVEDMDAGTPDIQYVDQTGDVGELWYYEVAAWNEVCGAEGP